MKPIPVLRLALPGLLLLSGGCHQPLNTEARVALARPAMNFEDALAEERVPAFRDQLEPGAAGTSGAQAVGCTTCK